MPTVCAFGPWLQLTTIDTISQRDHDNYAYCIKKIKYISPKVWIRPMWDKLHACDQDRWEREEKKYFLLNKKELQNEQSTSGI